MKKTQGWLLPLVIMFLVFGATVFVLNSNAHATAEILPNVEAEVPQIVHEQNVSPETEQEQLALSEQVQLLTENWANKNLKAGWIHVVTHQTLDYDVATTAPDGKPAPNDFIMDDWILLDDQNKEVNGVFLQRTNSGEIIQVSVLKDKTWFNLTFGDVIPAPDDLVYALDFGFPQVADRLKNELKKTTETINGKELTKYSAKEIYTSPSKVLEFNSAVNSIDTQAFFNAEGQLELYQTVFSLQDGSERSSMVEVITFEQVAAPPAEILDYLNQGVQK